jgi:hypothetical protein
MVDNFSSLHKHNLYHNPYPRGYEGMKEEEA